MRTRRHRAQAPVCLVEAEIPLQDSVLEGDLPLRNGPGVPGLDKNILNR